MSNLPWFWIGLGALVVVSVAVNLWLNQRAAKATPLCQHCDSKRVKEIKRDIVQSRTIEFNAGGMSGGGDVRLQFDYDLTYSCEDCDRKMVIRLTETQ
mgnify:CR=1 FL=1